MELETMQITCSSMEFDFNSGRTSPCGSRPSTPRGFAHDYYFSAPTSPMIYGGVEDYDDLGCNGYARGLCATNIKPKSPIKLETVKSPLLFPPSPNSIKLHKKTFWSHFSPKRTKKEPLNDETTIMDNNKYSRTTKQERKHRDIGGRHVTRSLSPLRVSRYPWEEQQQQFNSISMPPSPTLPLSSSSKGGKKWRLKDLLLFRRSASEGRALDNKDPMKKHLYMQWQNEVYKASNPQTKQGSSNSNAIIARRGPISAHELHYTVNKAISQDMKKKSFLPYKQGILGRLAINPSVHALAHGFGSLAHA